MENQDYQLRGHAFCTVSECKHNINGRCERLLHANVDDMTVTEKMYCSEYARKPLKHFCLDLDEEQIGALLTLLEPSSEDDPGDELYDKFMKINEHNPIAANMWFINVYYRQQIYGGPEEGGWWYHINCCEESRGYDAFDANQCSTPSLKYIVDKFFETVHDVFDDDEEAKANLDNGPSAEEIIKLLTETLDRYEFGQMLDMHGEGYFVAIERQPGAQHDMTRQHYE